MKITKILSPSVYNSWFKQIEFIEINNEIFLREPDNAFSRDYISWNFLDKIDLLFIRTNEENNLIAESDSNRLCDDAFDESYGVVG